MGEIDFQIQAVRKRLDELEMSFKLKGAYRETEKALIEYRKAHETLFDMMFKACNPPD